MKIKIVTELDTECLHQYSAIAVDFLRAILKTTLVHFRLQRVNERPTQVLSDSCDTTRLPLLTQRMIYNYSIDHKLKTTCPVVLSQHYQLLSIFLMHI